MSKPKKKFAIKNTTSPGKLAAIAEQIQIVKARYRGEKWAGLAVSIPGRGPQIPRHIQELMAYGARANKIVFLDWHANVVKSMKRTANKIGWAGLIKEANLFEFLEQQWNNNVQIDVIDCDDTGHLTKEHINMVREACKRNVKVITIVLSTRSSKLSDYMHGWKCTLGLSRFDNKGKQPIRDITVGAISHTAEKYGYTVEFIPYRGRGHHPMVACVITKK
jgi:hypothetical protein